MENKYLKSHLYYEGNKASKEYQIAKCMKILEMIAILRDRNANIKEFCKDVFGTSKSGAVLASNEYHKKYNNNLETIARLKQYYNSSIGKLQLFI